MAYTRVMSVGVVLGLLVIAGGVGFVIVRKLRSAKAVPPPVPAA